MSGPTRLLVKNIPFNKSNAHISPASPGRSHALRLGAHHCTIAFIPVYETCKPLATVWTYTHTHTHTDTHICTFTQHMHVDALICTHATTLCCHVAAVAVNSFNKRCTQMPARCWSLMGNEPFCLAAGAYSRAWQVVMVHLRYIQGGNTHGRYSRGGTRSAAVLPRTLLVKQMPSEYYNHARVICSLTQPLKHNRIVTRMATIVMRKNIVYQTKLSKPCPSMCFFSIKTYLFCKNFITVLACMDNRVQTDDTQEQPSEHLILLL